MLKKKELWIFGIVLVGALIAWGILTWQHSQKDYGSFTITVSGQEYGTYSLGKDQTILIGTTNECTVEDGKVRMTHADCPDHVCMEMSPIDERGGYIACLPNEVLIEGVASESAINSGLVPDAVTN